MEKPKVTLYCELYNFLGGIFYKNVGTGFLTSYKNQKKALEKAGIFFTENLKIKTDIFQANSHGPYTFFLAWKFRRRGNKIVFYAHSTVEDLRMNAKFLWVLSPLLRRYLSKLYNFADAVVCPSKYTVRLLNDSYAVPKDKTIFISNGVDAERFHFDPDKRKKFRDGAGISENDLVVADVAMAVKRKGIDTFVNLGKKFPKAKFIWYGKVFKGIFSYKIPKHTENVKFSGFVPDITQAYLSADIFLFPSYEEQQGISVLEAGSARLPIVVRNIPVYYDWMIDGVNCLKADTENDFEGKIALLLNDGLLRKRLGDTFYDEVMREHSFDSVGKKLNDLYLNILSK